MLVSVNFGCFAPSRCECYHCNAMRKAIKARMNWHKIQQNEHTPGFGVLLLVADLVANPGGGGEPQGG